jgi:hypothetical protein
VRKLRPERLLRPRCQAVRVLLGCNWQQVQFHCGHCQCRRARARWDDKRYVPWIHRQSSDYQTRFPAPITQSTSLLLLLLVLRARTDSLRLLEWKWYRLSIPSTDPAAVAHVILGRQDDNPSSYQLLSPLSPHLF